MIDPTPRSQPAPPDRDGAPPRPSDEAESSTLSAFARHIESLRWRLDGLRPEPASGSAEVFEALEATMEELRVAVEELRQTNDALRESRADVEDERRRYRDLFDLAPDPYVVTDLQGTIREANRAAALALNIDPHFVVGKPIVVFIPEEDRPAFRAELARARESPDTSEFDLKFRPRRLPPFDASIRVATARDHWGRPVALRWSIRDVSPQRRAEEEIRALNDRLERRVVERSEQLGDSLQAHERWLIKAHAADAADAAERAEGRLFQDLVEEVDAILWRADADTGRYNFVSRRAEELLGFPASSWLEDPDFWLAHVHPEDRDWAGAHRRKQLREGVDFEAEYRVVAADGRALWFRESIRVVRREPDGPAVLCGLMVNISRRKKVERQLHTAKGELTMQLRDMTYLHELGGRLAQARGWRETLDAVLAAVTSLQGAEMAAVLLREPGNDRMSLAAGVGLNREFAELLGRAPVDPGTLGKPLAAREMVAVEDVAAGGVDFRVSQAARIGGFRALLVVPLFAREGELLGAIATFFREPHRAPGRQARLVEMYAEQAAEAIEAARLLGQLQEAGRRKGRAVEEAAAEMRAPLAAILEAARSTAPGPARDLLERQARQLRDLLAALSESIDAQSNISEI